MRARANYLAGRVAPFAHFSVATLLPSGPSRPWALPELSFRWLTPRAHMFACLRINATVTDDAARLTTGLPGSALTGRGLHPLDDNSEFQGGIVNLLSHLTSISWSHPRADSYLLT